MSTLVSLYICTYIIKEEDLQQQYLIELEITFLLFKDI